jgi:hypothetical protein
MVTMSEQKKIFAVSLNDKRRFKAYAAYDGEVLVIGDLVEIGGKYRMWKGPLIAEILDRKGKGFVPLIEERTDNISRHGIQFDFEEMDSMEGRIHLYLALDYYFAMDSMGTVIIPKESAQFKITRNMVDIKQDEQGRTKYNVNWERLNGGHRAILLCVMAAMFDEMSGQYIDIMYREIMKTPASESPMRSFQAITRDVDKARAIKREEREEPQLAKAREIFRKNNP